jgi:Tol biopolymer transport system component
LTFAFNREGVWNIFWQDADGSGQAERLTTSEYAQIPLAWSPDGKILAFSESHPETGNDLWILPGDRKPEPFLRTEFNEVDSMFSPTGRWIAYTSDESGQDEVYVRPFPSSQGKRQVSTEGGRFPVWNPNGKEIFYRDGDKMMVVDVETEGELVLGKPRHLFEVPSLRLNYDVTLDGRRFVMIEHLQSRPVSDQLVLIQNWAEELKRLVPTN